MDERRELSSRLHPLDAARIGITGLRTGRLRAALAVLGIAVGIAALTAVVGISESSKSNLVAQLDRLGTDLLTVQPGTTFASTGQNDLPYRAPGMIARIPPVRHVTETVNTTATVRRTDKMPPYETGGVTVLGVATDLPAALDARVAEGTWLNDATAHYPTVVLGASAAQTLGINHLDPAVAVWIGQRWFTVIGILGPVAIAPELDQAVRT